MIVMVGIEKDLSAAAWGLAALPFGPDPMNPLLFTAM
jgi:hypothetical protein